MLYNHVNINALLIMLAEALFKNTQYSNMIYLMIGLVDLYIVENPFFLYMKKILAIKFRTDGNTSMIIQSAMRRRWEEIYISFVGMSGYI